MYFMHSFVIVKSKARETRNKPSIKHVTKRKLTFDEEQDSGEEGNGCTKEDGSKSKEESRRRSEQTKLIYG